MSRIMASLQAAVENFQTAQSSRNYKDKILLIILIKNIMT
jgi:hypothetical protein